THAPYTTLFRSRDDFTPSIPDRLGTRRFRTEFDSRCSHQPAYGKTAVRRGQHDPGLVHLLRSQIEHPRSNLLGREFPLPDLPTEHACRRNGRSEEHTSELQSRENL